MKRPLIALVLVALAFLGGCATRVESEAQPQALETDADKTLYALGFSMARSLRGVHFNDAETAMIQRGLSDGIAGRQSTVPIDVFGPKINAMMMERMTAAANVEKQAAKEFCDKMAASEGARRLPSGAIYIESQAGSGATPGPTDRVKVHYHGTLRDGTVFDSSVQKGTPAEFSLGPGMIPCFNEGLQQMKVGGKAKLVCPAETAYGEQGRPGIPGGAALVFELELLEAGAAAPPQPASP